MGGKGQWPLDGMLAWHMALWLVVLQPMLFENQLFTIAYSTGGHSQLAHFCLREPLLP